MKIVSIAISLIVTAFQCTAADRPNILWLTCEDNNVNWVGCYGNPHAETPNIDRLATEGFQYMHCYANAPVCAPSRSTWITGIHAISMGTAPMRSRYDIPHDQIKYYPDYLRAGGYYCANDAKTDYNIGDRSDVECWDACKHKWWKVNRQKHTFFPDLKHKQPFFQVINLGQSHESKAFGSVENTTHSPQDTRLAKYHPDIPTIRQNYAHYHDAVKKMDAEVGAVLEALENSGMAENTIVIHNSDHGGVLPRSKRFLFNSGTHCPLIIRIPEKFKHLWPADKPGTKVDRLVSFIDMPKTWLKIAGADIPDVMQGRVFLGPEADPERRYHVSFRERMDERCDNVRAIRNKRFLYIRNYMPFAPWGQHLNYLWRMEATRAWEAWHKAGKTDAVTGRWFGTKPMQELYDTSKDPDNVVNLIDKPEYREVVEELRRELRKWQVNIRDSGLLPEAERMKRAADYQTTVYEMVRNRKQYDLEAYLDASDLALQQDSGNLAALLKLLDHKDPGIRYWGIVGCYLVADEARSAQPRIRHALSDDSHVVRAMAAYTLYRQGDTGAAKACFKDLLKNHSYASLLVLNIIDWIGAGPDEYRDEIVACQFKHGGGDYVKWITNYFGCKKTTPERKRGKTAQTGAAALAVAAHSKQATAKSQEGKRPNILLIFSDQQHWQAMGFMNPFFETPNQDTFAEESVVFERSFCTTPQCSPSRSSLLTGMYPSKTKVFGNIGATGGNPLNQPTIAKELQDAGYTTGYFGKWRLGRKDIATTGWTHSDRKTNDRRAENNALTFLKDLRKPDKPFALFVSLHNPHDIYYFKQHKPESPVDNIPVPKSWQDETFQDKPPVQKQFMNEDQGTVIVGKPKKDWQTYRDCYHSKIKLYDNNVGAILDELKRQGQYENTIIILTSDHGDMDTEHRLIFKGPFMYEHMMRIPLMIRVPTHIAKTDPKRVKDLDVVNVDIAPTIRDLCDLPARASDGISLAPLFTASEEYRPRDFVIGQYYSKQRWVNPIRTIRTKNYKLNRHIRWGDELYDLNNDPHELKNLAEKPKYAEIKQDLVKKLDQWIKDHDDPFYSLHATSRKGEQLD